MARGRFISKEITIDKKVNGLSSAYSMLAFTWLLTHTDGFGRTHGDPAVVRSIIFPRRPEVTVDDVEGYIREWNDAGLINWYEVAGDMYIEFPKFPKHQVGLRLDKEAKSNIPPNPANVETPPELPDNPPENDGQLPTNSGQIPEKSGQMAAEVKLSRSEFEGEFEGEVVVEGDNSSDLLTAFCSITHLPQPAVKALRDTWISELAQLQSKGVDANILRRAVTEITDKGDYQITAPHSIFKACDVVIARSKRKGTDGYVPVSATEYAGAVIR